MRKFELRNFTLDEKTREATFSVASAEPCSRYDWEREEEYLEILEIREETVKLDRLKGGASLLFGHDPDKILGCIVDAWPQDGKLYVKARFSSALKGANEIFSAIQEGTVKNVSIGYSVDHYTREIRDGMPARIVDLFEVFEVSIVGVPADASVGFRSLLKREDMPPKEPADKPAAEAPAEEKEAPSTDAAEKEEATPEEPADKPAEEAPAEELPEEGKEEKKAPSMDAEEEEAIKAAGEALGIGKEECVKAIASGMNYREFKLKYGKATKQKGNAMNRIKTEVADFFRNAARNGSVANYSLRDFTGLGGQSGENGAALIGEELTPIVALLNKRMGVKGYRTISGQKQTLVLPVQTTDPTITQTTTPRDAGTASTPVFTDVTLTPHKLVGEVVIGRDVLLQANGDIVGYVIDRLTRQISYKVEDYMLGKVATGAGTTVTMAGSAPTWADVLAFERALGAYELLPSWVMNPSAKATLKATPKVAGYPDFLCDAEGKVNGYEVNVSGVELAGKVYFGDWSRLLLVTFGDGLDILVDPYTHGSEGNIKIVASLAVDACVEQSAAFAAGTLPAGA